MAIRINEVNSATLSEDQKEVVVDCSGRYTGPLELRFSRDCFDRLLQALMQQKGVAEPAKVDGPAAVTTPAIPIPPAKAPATTAPPVSATPPAAAVDAAKTGPDEVRVEVVKNMAVTADPTGRGFVILIVNHRLQDQRGYALTPDAAANVADGLTKGANAMRAAKPSGQQPS